MEKYEKQLDKHKARAAKAKAKEDERKAKKQAKKEAAASAAPGSARPRQRRWCGRKAKLPRPRATCTKYDEGDALQAEITLHVIAQLVYHPKRHSNTLLRD